MSDGFLSVVEHESEPRLLHVRGRIKGDIEHVFPEADVIETVEGDYRFRTSLPRERVAHAIALRISKIDYTNFKNSVDDVDRKQAYIGVWSVMFGEQQRLYGNPTRDTDAPLKHRPAYELSEERYEFAPVDDVEPSEAGNP